MNEFLKLIASICKKIIRTAFITAIDYTPKIIIKGLPKNRLGDKIFSLHAFVRIHKRFPDDTKFNDKLHKIKTTKLVHKKYDIKNILNSKLINKYKNEKIYF